MKYKEIYISHLFREQMRQSNKYHPLSLHYCQIINEQKSTKLHPMYA